MAKVIVGMSGGVDSAVTAYLLKVAGYDVIGVTLRTWLAADGKESRCCEIDDAGRVAASINIPYYAVNSFTEFTEFVTRPFVKDYICGLTPSPCVECNRFVKWEGLMRTASVMQAEYVATGHYATPIRLENGRYTVKKAVHAQKDQTYMLYKLTQEQLAHTIMPLGKLSKEEVRKIAEVAGLAVAQKKDSQEICFVPSGDYADFIEENAECELPGCGNFVDEDGNIIGRHKGIIHYTVGQRKGLGVALGYPVFVKHISADTNEIVLAEEKSIFNSEIICDKVNYLSIAGLEPGLTIRARVKIRYRHLGEMAEISANGSDSVRIVFDSPVKAATPGQSAVFYDEADCLIGGGRIREVK